MVSHRQRNLLELLLRNRQLSRAQLHVLSGVRKMAVSLEARRLLHHELVRECGSLRIARGRPQTPLEIDPSRRHVVGLMIRPGQVEVSRCNLLGEPISDPIRRSVASPGRLVGAATDLLRAARSKRTLAVGIAVPGFVDPIRRRILISSAWPMGDEVNLEPLYAAAGDLPLIIENDVHALAARWMIEQKGWEGEDDVLIVFHDDGQVGATMLIDGHPNSGCVIGANELGHMRLCVDTERCYCGGTGCLERVFSTAYLRKLDARAHSLSHAAARFDGSDQSLNQVIDLFGTSLANAVNFSRVGHVVLASELNSSPLFAESLVAAVRRQLLPVLAQRVKISFWGHHARSARTASALALANVYFNGWTSTKCRRVAGAA